ncbi:MAG: DUF6382 domain-containing protein [Lachnospiraceae bacterium]|nr:DUF6382 domain-containing protein [Lachnospiraceae bacterium]
MKVRYVRELGVSKLRIETRMVYQEDYQMRMMEQNNIVGLVQIECCMIDGESSFIYDVTGMQSMNKRYAGERFGCKEMYKIIEDLTEVNDSLEKYLLNSNCLLLDPAYIFWAADRWHFLYLPVKKSLIDKSFHELTEYFVRTIDYEEKEAIHLASLLHKETLMEHFDLKQIWERHQKRKEEMSIPIISSEIIDSNDFEDEEKKEKSKQNHPPEESYVRSNQNNMIREKKGNFLPFRKKQKRSGQGRWGDWEDLITDADGQSDSSPL